MNEIQIKRYASNCDYSWVEQYGYQISNDKSIIVFFQCGSGDLIMDFIPKNDDIYSFPITKNNSLLYNLIDELYNNILNTRIYRDRDIKYGELQDEKYYKRMLDMIYNGKSIIWKSDAPIIDNTKLYNYLKIDKEDNTYILSFTSDNLEKHIVVEFNTDRSRYLSFVFEFWNLIKKMEDITEPYRQITIDEYLNNKQLLLKK